MQKPGFTLRMPDELEEKLREAAQESRRSVTQEIIYRLDQTFTPNWHEWLKAQPSPQIEHE